MSGELAMFEIRATNMRSRETLCFLGQGRSFADAVRDGLHNLQNQPKRYGNNVSVETPDGRRISSTLDQFERPAIPADNVEMDFA